MKKRVFQILQTAAFVGLGIFLIVYFWGRLSAKEQTDIIDNFTKANYWWILLALAAGIVSHIVRSARWNLLIETFSPPPTLGQTFWAVMAGYLANLAVPRLGEFTRCGLLTKQSGVPFDKLFGSVLAERAFDMFIYLLLFLSSIVFFYDKIESYLHDKILSGFSNKLAAMNTSQLLLMGLVTVAFLFISYLILRRFRNKPLIVKIRAILRNLLKGLLSIFKLKRVGLFLLYTLIIWLMYWLMVFLVYFSLPSTSALPAESAFVVVVFGTIGIILIQGGIGIYPIIVSEVLLIYGASVADGFAIGWLSWTVQTAMILILGLLAFVMASLNKKKRNGLQEPDKIENTVA